MIALCIAGHLAASLAQGSVAHFQVTAIKNVFRHCQMPTGAKPPVEIHWFGDKDQFSSNSWNTLSHPISKMPDPNFRKGCWRGSSSVWGLSPGIFFAAPGMASFQKHGSLCSPSPSLQNMPQIMVKKLSELQIPSGSNSFYPSSGVPERSAQSKNLQLSKRVMNVSTLIEHY